MPEFSCDSKFVISPSASSICCFSILLSCLLFPSSSDSDRVFWDFEGEGERERERERERESERCKVRKEGEEGERKRRVGRSGARTGEPASAGERGGVKGMGEVTPSASRSVGEGLARSEGEAVIEIETEAEAEGAEEGNEERVSSGSGSGLRSEREREPNVGWDVDVGWRG